MAKTLLQQLKQDEKILQEICCRYCKILHQMKIKKLVKKNGEKRQK